jgi:hypothetical protein
VRGQDYGQAAEAGWCPLAGYAVSQLAGCFRNSTRILKIVGSDECVAETAAATNAIYLSRYQVSIIGTPRYYKYRYMCTSTS